MDPKLIRNFSIIAHIDHGKSIRSPWQSQMLAKVGGRILSPPDTPHRGAN